MICDEENEPINDHTAIDRMLFICAIYQGNEQTPGPTVGASNKRGRANVSMLLFVVVQVKSSMTNSHEIFRIADVVIDVS